MATGRTGADAIFRFLGHICRTLVRYQTKLLILIDQLEADLTITAEQATTARLLVSSANAFCNVFNIISQNSGF